MSRDDWIDEDEYPNDEDVDAFGDYSPPDDHPLTVGYVGALLLPALIDLFR